MVNLIEFKIFLAVRSCIVGILVIPTSQHSEPFQDLPTKICYVIMCIMTKFFEGGRIEYYDHIFHNNCVQIGLRRLLVDASLDNDHKCSVFLHNPLVLNVVIVWNWKFSLCKGIFKKKNFVLFLVLLWCL